MTTDKPSILIIDDDTNLRKTLTDILRAKGYETLAAKDGTEGLSLLRQHTVHLALVDLRLPDISGLEILSTIRAAHPHTEAIILTGNASLDSAIEATNKGAFSYLQKPYDMDQLMLHIRRAIEKQQTERLIRESEEKFRILAEKSPNVIFINKMGRVVYVNEKNEELLGYTKEEIYSPGFDFLTLIAPEYTEKVKTAFLKQMNGEDVPPFEYVLIGRNGRRVDAIITSKIIPFEGGTAILGIVTDISERKKQEEHINKLNEKLEHRVEERTSALMCATEEVKESEERFRAIFDSAADGILLADPESKRFYLGNRAISQMLGYTLEEISTLGVMDIHPKESLSSIIQQFEKASNEHVNYTNEIPMKRKDGSVFYADLSGIPITLKGKKYLLGMFRDITERRNASEALQNALIASEASNRAKSEFLANMSHELTTPLNAVIGFSQVLKDGLYGKLNDKQKEYVDDILQGGLHLLRILNEIIELSRLESGNQGIKPDRFLLKDALKSSVAVFNDKAIKRNLKLTIEIEPDAEIEIETDSGKLTRVLYNLIDNAVKFTPDGGSVRVTARKAHGSELIVHGKTGVSSELSAMNYEPDRNFVEVSVEDTGIGIKPENIGRLFQPFSQLEPPYTKSHGGTGIGLILTKKLVDLMGGKIWVESEYGEGSKFTFVIPIRQNAESRSQESE